MLSGRLKSLWYNDNFSSIFANIEKHVRSAMRGKLKFDWIFAYEVFLSLVEIHRQLVQLCGVHAT
jgi:hypothetical protein